jgi:hypothetical protein
MHGLMLAKLAVVSKSYAALDHLISCGVDPAEVRCQLMNKGAWSAARILTSTGRVRKTPPSHSPPYLYRETRTTVA